MLRELIASLKQWAARREWSTEDTEPSFWDLAADMRAMTRGRQTPSESLVREGREER
jgi:hypothetical protein